MFIDNLYIVDNTNQRIRKIVSATGIIYTIAGSSTSCGYGGDNGPATSALLNYPHAIGLDTAGRLKYVLSYSLFNVVYYYLGNVYIADLDNNRIRKVTISTGTITTIAGTGTGSFSGDGGDAKLATLNWPAGVAVDSTGTHDRIITSCFLCLSCYFKAMYTSARETIIASGRSQQRRVLSVRTQERALLVVVETTDQQQRLH